MVDGNKLSILVGHADLVKGLLEPKGDTSESHSPPDSRLVVATGAVCCSGTCVCRGSEDTWEMGLPKISHAHKVVQRRVFRILGKPG